MAPATGVAHVADPDRVRANTHPDVNRRIDRQAEERVRAAASEPDIEDRLDKLNREWDFDRIIEAEAAVTGLTGLALSVLVDRRFLVIPAVATAMMLVHSLQGWYPLLPLLRHAGIRSQDEIERERYALKTLRGDFEGVSRAAADRRAEAAWLAVQA